MAKESKVLVKILGKDETKGAVQTAGNAFKTLGKLALGAAGIYGVGAIVSGIKDLAKEGANLLLIEGAFNSVAESAGETGSAVLSAMQKATAGTVPAVEMMQSYNLAAQLIGKEFANNLPNAMEPLMKVAGATGDSMGYLMDSLVRGVGRLSPMILDNLGIQVNLNEAYETFAKENGLVASELTKTEQQMALMNQVTELLSRNTEALPDVTDSAQVAFAQWDATLADTKATIGAGLIPLLLPLIEGLREVTTWVGILGKYFRVVGEDGDYLNDYLSQLPEWMQPGVQGIGEFIGKFQEMGGIGEILTGLNLQGILATILPPGFAETFNNLKAAVMNVVEAFMLHWPQIEASARYVVNYFIENVWPAFQSVFTSIMELVTTILNGIAVFWNKWGGDIINIARGTFLFIYDIVAGALNLVASIVKAVTAVLKGDFSAAWEYIKTGVVAFGLAIWNSIKNFGERTKSAWSRIWESVKETVFKIFSPIVEKMIGWWDSIRDAIQGVVSKITSFIEKIKSVAANLLKLKLPSWLTPGSPTPLENAMSNLVRLSGQLAGIDPFASVSGVAPGMAVAGGGYAGGAGATNNITIEINGARDSTEVAQEVAKALRLQGVRF